MRHRRGSEEAQVVAAACGAGGGGGGGAGGVADSLPVEVTEASFDCILDGTKVRRFYVKNLLDDLAASVAVAEGEAPLPYPRGTLLQLVPFEAMVKREVGFSEETNDWEFFALLPTDEGTEIATRGNDAVNFLGDTCFECHSAAANNDFVCETDNGCVSLPTPAEVIITLQEADPRCE
ncbi:MAG: hypothetical protein JRG93_09150 [Deltaproteobacteria bacterium]|nr:hypothetical protein [Deltaproteobacteria bacterium]MBW2222851.1 hypothetical protein [Deltaproteobacteria bacterium]MBW2402336.1 hypothetical protein [Deltaproteobacteria bacterium]